MNFFFSVLPIGQYKFDDTKSVHSITTTNLPYLHHVSVSTGNLKSQTNIIAQLENSKSQRNLLDSQNKIRSSITSQANSEKNNFINKLPKCCRKLAQLKKCFNVFHGRKHFSSSGLYHLDNKSVLTQHLQEIDSLRLVN